MKNFTSWLLAAIVAWLVVGGVHHARPSNPAPQVVPTTQKPAETPPDWKAWREDPNDPKWLQLTKQIKPVPTSYPAYADDGTALQPPPPMSDDSAELPDNFFNGPKPSIARHVIDRVTGQQVIAVGEPRKVFGGYEVRILYRMRMDIKEWVTHTTKSRFQNESTLSSLELSPLVAEWWAIHTRYLDELSPIRGKP